MIIPVPGVSFNQVNITAAERFHHFLALVFAVLWVSLLPSRAIPSFRAKSLYEKTTYRIWDFFGFFCCMIQKRDLKKAQNPHVVFPYYFCAELPQCSFCFVCFRAKLLFQHHNGARFYSLFPSICPFCSSLFLFLLSHRNHFLTTTTNKIK